MLRYVRHAFIWVERALCHFEHDAVALDRFTLTAIAVAVLALILAFSGPASDAIVLIAFVLTLIFIFIEATPATLLEWKKRPLVNDWHAQRCGMQSDRRDQIFGRGH